MDEEKNQRISDLLKKTSFQIYGEKETVNSSQEDKVSLDDYTHPQLTDALREKIRQLKKITNSIEDNVIKEPVYRETAGYKINYEKSLNEMQFLAATTLEGPLLVIAGAGTGKTRTLIYRVAYLIENKVKPQKILLLTFTRKASREMLERASLLLNDLSAQKVMGGTFHAFSNYLLRKYAGLLGIAPNFSIIDQSDSRDVLDLVLNELNIKQQGRVFPKKARIQDVISRARNCNRSLRELIENDYTNLLDYLSELELIKEAYGRYKKNHNIFDYDDLMDFLRDSLKYNEPFMRKVQKEYDYIMVDEFQDTNVVQKEIVDLIAGEHRNLMVVGDDSQSIYSFRGANFENILRFPKAYPACKIVKLEENYRSSQAILDFTNAVIDNAAAAYKKRLFSRLKESEKPLFKQFFSQEDEAGYIVSRMLELNEQGLPFKEMAVLYRASFHGNYIQAELLKRSIPYVVYGGIKFIERRHVKDIFSYLRIILNPYDAVAWNRVLKLLPGIGQVTASRVIRHIHDNKGVISFKPFQGSKYGKSLDDLAAVLSSALEEKENVAEQINILQKYYFPILKNLEEDFQVRMQDIEVLHALGKRYDRLDTFLADLTLDPPSSKFQDKSTPRVEEGEEKPLVLSTIHSAKGLEWDTVFVPHLLDGLFPGTKACKNILEMEEERRLFYVACTRAKKRLFLTMPFQVYSYSGLFTMPSRFLMEVGQELLDNETDVEF